MARQDLNKGFGNLPPWLNDWTCPKCKKSFPIEKWDEVFIQVGPNNLSGRKCPECDWQMCQAGETQICLDADEKAKKIIEDRDKANKGNKDEKENVVNG